MKNSVFFFMFFAANLYFGQGGKVGINTAVPKSSLDVNGLADSSGVSLTTDITGLQAPRLTRAELTAKGNSLYGTNQRGALVYITDITGGAASGQMVNITSQGYYYFDGTVWIKVGSGTLTGVTADNGLSNSSASNIQLGGTLIKNTEIDQNGRYLSLTNTGNVGIGTPSSSTPIQKLDVRGNVNVENTNAGIVVNSTDNNPSRFVLTRSNGGTNLAVNDEIGRINFNGRRNNAIATLSTILSTYEGDGTTNSTGFEFYNNGNLGTPTMVLRSNGNLGIRTAFSLGDELPTERLDVSGNIRFRSVPTTATLTAGDEFLVLSSNGTGKKIANPASNSLITANNALTKTGNNVELGGALTKNTIISGLTATNNMQFTGTGVDAFNIDGTTFSVDATNNRIGIGTSSPTQSLEVTGNGLFKSDASTGVVIESDGADFSRLVLGRRNNGTAIPNNAVIGRINFNGQESASAYETLAYIASTFTDNGGALRFFVKPNLGTVGSNNEGITIYRNGNVGFDNPSPTFPIHHGNGARLTTAGVWTNASDARLKDHITGTQYGLKEVLELNPVHYTMKKDGTEQIGLIAQEVKKILPEVVSGTEGDIEKGETLGISYGNIVPVLINAIKEQQSQIEKLKKEVEKLKTKN